MIKHIFSCPRELRETKNEAFSPSVLFLYQLTDDIRFPGDAIQVTPVDGNVRVGRVFVVFDSIRFVEGQKLRIPVDHEEDTQARAEKGEKQAKVRTDRILKNQA